MGSEQQFTITLNFHDVNQLPVTTYLLVLVQLDRDDGCLLSGVNMLLARWRPRNGVDLRGDGPIGTHLHYVTFKDQSWWVQPCPNSASQFSSPGMWYAFRSPSGRLSPLFPVGLAAAYPHSAAWGVVDHGVQSHWEQSGPHHLRPNLWEPEQIRNEMGSAMLWCGVLLAWCVPNDTVGGWKLTISMPPTIFQYESRYSRCWVPKAYCKAFP